MAAYSSRYLPFLDSEPRTLGIAPPPYRSCHDDDSTSGRYSDSSFSSSGIKRRASWTNFVEADENLNKFKVNVYPKISSHTTTASVASSNMAHPLPNKIPLSNVNPLPAGSLHGSNTSVSHSYYGGGQPAVNYHARPSSRSVNSTNNSMVNEFFVMPKGSYQKLNYASPMPPGATPIPLDNPTQFSVNRPRKSNKMESLRQLWKKPACKFISALIVLLLIVGIILAIVLPLTLMMPNHFTMNWQAPDMIRNRHTGSNNLQLDIEGDQARFNLRGAVPFHSNFISVYDFKSNKIAIIDSAFQTGGKTLVCFLMDLNRQTLADLSTLKRAANNAKNKSNQTQGWQEAWNYVPSPITNFQAASVFKPDVQECRNARWVELSFVNSNQKPTRCSDCYDFCLPDYGIERDVIRNEEYLNIVRRDCFYMYVPEWKNYAQGYPQQQQGQQLQQGQPGYQLTQTTLTQVPYGTNQQLGVNPNIPGQYPNGQQNQQFGVNNNQQQQQQYPGQYGSNQQQQQQQQGMSPLQALNQLNNNNNNNQNQQGYGAGGGGGGPGRTVEESRWISLANVPQQIANRTSDVFTQGRQQVTQWGQQIGQNLGILPNNQNNNNQMNNNQPNPLNSPYGFNPTNPNYQTPSGYPNGFMPSTANYNPDRPNDRNGQGVYIAHNINGMDYQQQPLIQQPSQTANINGMLNTQNHNQGMVGPPYNVAGSGNSELQMASSSVGSGSGSGSYSLVRKRDSGGGGVVGYGNGKVWGYSSYDNGNYGSSDNGRQNNADNAGGRIFPNRGYGSSTYKGYGDPNNPGNGNFNNRGYSTYNGYSNSDIVGYSNGNNGGSGYGGPNNAGYRNSNYQGYGNSNNGGYGNPINVAYSNLNTGYGGSSYNNYSNNNSGYGSGSGKSYGSSHDINWNSNGDRDSDSIHRGGVARSHGGAVINHLAQSAGYGDQGSAIENKMRGQIVITEDSGASKPHYHFITPRDVNRFRPSSNPNFHTQSLYKEKPPSNVYYANNQPVQLTPPGWNDSFKHAKETRLESSFFAHPNLPSPFPAPLNGPQSPQQRPLFPSQSFNPVTVREQNKWLKSQTNQGPILGAPSDYFNQQGTQRNIDSQNQQLQQLQRLSSGQQVQVGSTQQIVGQDLSAQPPAGQNNVAGDIRWLQNFGRK